MNEKAIQAFRDCKLGLFVHWGLYAALGGRYKGQTMKAIGEWVQSQYRIPKAEYARLAGEFNPVGFDADEWIRKATDAGMRYLVFTTKHHDGFAMYHSKVSAYNIVDMSPFGRDPLMELAEACSKYNMKFGIYYSHYLDWEDPNGGDPKPEIQYLNNGDMSWGNDWDYPDQSKKDFKRYFSEKCIPQITELLTQYGPVSELWCDCAMNIRKDYSEALRDVVHQLQPDCLINSRIGNNCGDFGSLGDNQLLAGRSDAILESPGTLNNTWGYKVDDDNWKTGEQILGQFLSLVEKNANYLLNVGPQPDGRFTPETDQVLADLATWYARHGEAVYAAKGTPFAQGFDFAKCTSKDNKIHLFLEGRPQHLKLLGVRSPITAANVNYTQDGDVVELQVPDLGTEMYPRITLEFAQSPEIDQNLLPQNGALLLTPSEGTLVLGEDFNGGAEGKVIGFDVAAEAILATNHSLLEKDGTLSQWHNPDDRLEWVVRFPEAGSYQVWLRTASRGHSAPWLGRRRVDISFGDWTVTEELKADRVIHSLYYHAAETLIGELTVKAGACGALAMRTKELLDPDASEMNFTQLLLQRVDV